MSLGTRNELYSYSGFPRKDVNGAVSHTLHFFRSTIGLTACRRFGESGKFVGGLFYFFNRPTTYSSNTAPATAVTSEPIIPLACIPSSLNT